MPSIKRMLINCGNMPQERRAPNLAWLRLNGGVFLFLPCVSDQFPTFLIVQDALHDQGSS